MVDDEEVVNVVETVVFADCSRVVSFAAFVGVIDVVVAKDGALVVVSIDVCESRKLKNF